MTRTWVRRGGWPRLWRARCVPLIAVAVALVLPATGDAIPAVSITLLGKVGSHLVPGDRGVLQASVPLGSWCRLTLSHFGARGVASGPRVATSRLAQFAWGVQPNAAGGQWRATVRCARSRAVTLHQRGGETASVVVVVQQKHKGRYGSLTRSISVRFPRSGKSPTTGLGGGSYPRYGELLISGGTWLAGHGVNVYSNGGDGNLTGAYPCVELVNRLITTRGGSPSIYGDAHQLYANASSTYFDKHRTGAAISACPVTSSSGVAAMAATVTFRSSTPTVPAC